MIIRKIDIIDADAFWKMQFALDKETKWMMYEPNERTKNLDLINNLIQKSQNGIDLLLVAEIDKDIVGFLSAQRGVPRRIRHTANIVIGIRKAFQGKGIGSGFFKELDLWALQNGIKRLELTVMCPNIVAKKLYEKNGFVIEGVKRKAMFVDGEYIDEFYMAKLF